MAWPETAIVQFKSKKPIAQLPTQGFIMSGTVDLEAATTVVAGVPVNADTLIIGTLQEKKNGLLGVLIDFIAVEPLPDGSNSFKVYLTTAPLLNQTVLLGFAVFVL